MARVRDEGAPGIAPNIIDRALSYVAPRLALDRYRARVQFGMIGGFVGASFGRRSMSMWATSRGSADADLLPALPLLRVRSRDLARNDPLASGAISGTVTSVVGTGLALQSTIDADYLKMSDDDAEAWQRTTEREFKLWAESTDCDITRHQDFYGLQALVFRSTLENGDAATLLPFVPRKGSIYDLRVQVIEADRIANTDFAGDTPALAAGVAMDQYGAPTAYHIMREHPGSYFGTANMFKWDIYPAFGAKTGRRNVLHHFNRVRPGQTRGVPYLAPVIETLKQLSRYSEAEIMAAVVSGMFSVFVTTEGGQGIGTGIPGIANENGATASDQDIKVGYGSVLDLRPGESISTASPGRPNANFDPFFLACVRQIGVALELPFEVLIKHFTASYTAARAAILEAWKFYRGRRAWLAQSFNDPVYEAWMEEAVALGRISAPGFFTDPAIRRAYLMCTWTGDAMPQVDPVKEVEAARGRVDLGVSDRSQETTQLTGGDWETTHKQQVREANMRKEAGLDPVPPPLKAINAVDPSQGGDIETTPPAGDKRADPTGNPGGGN